MKKVVITGPTGAIGVALIQKCVQEGTHVLAICRKNSKRRKQIPVNPLVDIVECDLSELKNLEIECEQDYDVFYHFGWMATIGAGRNDMYAQLKNIEYAIDAVGLAERLGCKTFVGAGSQAEYGRVEGKLTDRTPVFPENGYGMAKLCAGQMTRVECQKKNIRHIWTRILSVYGPYDGDKTMISTVIRKLLAGEKPSLTPGEQKWDYLYSADAAEAMYLIGEKGKENSTYCIGSGCVRTLKEYVEILRDHIDKKLELGIGDIPYGDKQVMYLCADITKLSKDTGFSPKTPFECGIDETIAWHSNNNQIQLEKEVQK